MRWDLIVRFFVLLPFFFVAQSSAGEIRREGNAYSGARSVSWTQSPATADSFTVRISAFYPKGARAPYSYRLELSTKSNYWQYLQCGGSDRITALSGDRDKSLTIHMQYSNALSGSSMRQVFSATVPFESIEFLSESSVIMFALCGTSGNITTEATSGAKEITEAIQ